MCTCLPTWRYLVEPVYFLPTKADVILAVKFLANDSVITIQQDGILVHTENPDPILKLVGLHATKLGHNAVRLKVLPAHLGIWNTRLALIAKEFFYPL